MADVDRTQKPRDPAEVPPKAINRANRKRARASSEGPEAAGTAMSASTKAASDAERSSARRAAAAPKAPPVGPLAMLAQLVVVAAAAGLVYSFVTVAKDGELRRRCAPACILQPDYHANISGSSDNPSAPRMAPNFTLKDMDGRPVSLADYRGKVVILNFWMKSCPPCLEEFPDLVELAQTLAPRKDVAVLSISIDEGPESVQDSLKAILRDKPPFPILFDPDAQVVRGIYGTSQFPETWIIDKLGRIRARFDGKRAWTSGPLLELIEQVRTDDFCPLEIKKGVRSGQAQRLHVCDDPSNGAAGIANNAGTEK